MSSHISEKDIEKIARLARIEVAKTSLGAVAKDLEKIIGFVDTLKEVDTNNVEALTNISEFNLRLEKDEVAQDNDAEDVLKNAKNAKYGYFAVPKVIE